MRHAPQLKSGLFRSLMKTASAVTSTALLAIAIPGNSALANNNQNFTDYAKVVHVEPSFRYVTVKVPQRICSPGYNNNSGHYNNNLHNNNRRNRGQHVQRTGNRRNDASAAVFIGGIIGGAIGHEVSKNINGRSNVAATLTGAVIGSTLAGAANYSSNQQGQHYAHNGANHHNRPHQSHKKSHKRHHRQHHNNHQRCTTTTQSRQERRANGYNVTYVYHGRTFHTRTQHHPGHRIAVQIAVSTH